MLSIEENEMLTKVGAGTPVGELMRRYWHPVATSQEIKENPVKAVRLLGESLTLFQDRQGRLGLIDDPPSGTIDIGALKRKSVSLHWELMFTRSLFGTVDLIEQHKLLAEVARLVDAGELRTTLGEHFGRIDAANLRRAHAVLESGKARGKIVLEGF